MTTHQLGGLSPRQDQVLGLIGCGLTNREIGQQLGIAEKTVKNTVTVVFAKLGLHHRAQAAVYVTVRDGAHKVTVRDPPRKPMADHHQ